MNAPLSVALIATISMAVNLTDSKNEDLDTFAQDALKDSIPDMLADSTDILKQLASKLDEKDVLPEEASDLIDEADGIIREVTQKVDEAENEELEKELEESDIKNAVVTVDVDQEKEHNAVVSSIDAILGSIFEEEEEPVQEVSDNEGEQQAVKSGDVIDSGRRVLAKKSFTESSFFKNNDGEDEFDF